MIERHAHIPAPEPPQPGVPGELPPAPSEAPPPIDDPKPLPPVRDPPPDERPNPKRLSDNRLIEVGVKLDPGDLNLSSGRELAVTIPLEFLELLLSRAEPGIPSRTSPQHFNEALQGDSVPVPRQSQMICSL